MHCLDELTPKFVARVCERLANDHAKRWRGIAMDHKSRFDEYPEFSVFVDFVQRLAQDVNDPLYGYAIESPTRPVEVCKRAQTVSHNMTATHNNGSLHKCTMCKSVHRLTQCPIFKNEGMESRLDFVNTHNLCYICIPANSPSLVRSLRHFRLARISVRGDRNLRRLSICFFLFFFFVFRSSFRIFQL